MSSKNKEEDLKRPENAKDDATSPAPESKDNVDKKGQKRYELDTLKRNVPKEEKETFDKMGKEEQKRYIINAWVQENRTLDKSDMHEVSLEEEKLIGLQT